MRARKPARIIEPGVVGSDVAEAVYRATLPLDEVAHKMEMKWGIDRLEKLVTPDLAAKFGVAKAHLDKAIDDNDPAMVVQKASALIRGWHALDQYATSQGAPIISEVAAAAVWNWRDPVSGEAFAIAVDEASARTVGSELDVTVYTLDEIARILAHERMKVVNMAKKVFPNSRVKKVTNTRNTPLNDSIPF